MEISGQSILPKQTGGLRKQADITKAEAKGQKKDIGKTEDIKTLEGGQNNRQAANLINR